MSRINNWFITEQIYQYINGSWNIIPEREYFIKCNMYDTYYNLLYNSRQPEILDSEYRYTDGGFVRYSDNPYIEEENGFNYDFAATGRSSRAKFMMCGGGYDLSTDGNMQSKFKEYYLIYV